MKPMPFWIDHETIGFDFDIPVRCIYDYLSRTVEWAKEVERFIDGLCPRDREIEPDRLFLDGPISIYRVDGGDQTHQLIREQDPDAIREDYIISITFIGKWINNKSHEDPGKHGKDYFVESEAPAVTKIAITTSTMQAVIDGIKRLAKEIIFEDAMIKKSRNGSPRERS